MQAQREKTNGLSTAERICARVVDGEEGRTEPVCLHFNICTLQQAVTPLLKNWKAGKSPVDPLHLARICNDYLRGPVMETEEDRVLLDKEG